MKYETTKDFIDAVTSGEFVGRVVVDNDQVYAYSAPDNDDEYNGEKVFDFEDCGPEGALIDVLTALGVPAERP